MKAVYIEEPGRVYLKDVGDPIPKEGQALVRVKAVGICGSDVAAYKYNHPNCTYPFIIGHEVAGVIEEIPDGSDLKKGERVILDPYMNCGECYSCLMGRPNCCEKLKVLGVQTDGAMSEFFAHPVNKLIKAPDALEWSQIPLAEPLTISLHALHHVKPKQGERLTVIGAGAIGIMAAMVAKSWGAIPIILDADPKRLEMALAAGIENTINVLEEDAEAKIRELTNGRMSETVMEASGSDAGVAGTVKYASYIGRIALTGWPKGDVSMATSLITRKELTVFGSRNSAGEFEEALELLATGVVDPGKIITGIVPFEELPTHVEMLSRDPGSHLKIVGVV